jgi:hypothetical protein
MYPMEYSKATKKELGIEVAGVEPAFVCVIIRYYLSLLFHDQPVTNHFLFPGGAASLSSGGLAAATVGGNL